MRVNIICEGAIIGHADLKPVDPPMGVAAGNFVPAPSYQPCLHAVTIDGIENEFGANARLSVCSDEDEMLICQGIVIEDFKKTFQEISVTVLGIGYPQYERVFAHHPQFKAYWTP